MSDSVNHLDNDRAPGHLPARFEITATEDTDALLVTLHGELDLADVTKLRSVVDRAERSVAPVIVVDLRALVFIDSSGLRELLRLHRHTTASGQELRLLPGPPVVRRIIEVSGLGDVLPFSS
jgi:anti-sigma B factor antagonist